MDSCPSCWSEEADDMFSKELDSFLEQYEKNKKLIKDLERLDYEMQNL